MAGQHADVSPVARTDARAKQEFRDERLRCVGCATAGQIGSERRVSRTDLLGIAGRRDVHEGIQPVIMAEGAAGRLQVPRDTNRIGRSEWKEAFPSANGLQSDTPTVGNRTAQAVEGSRTYALAGVTVEEQTVASAAEPPATLPGGITGALLAVRERKDPTEWRVAAPRRARPHRNLALRRPAKPMASRAEPPSELAGRRRSALVVVREVEGQSVWEMLTAVIGTTTPAGVPFRRPEERMTLPAEAPVGLACRTRTHRVRRSAERSAN